MIPRIIAIAADFLRRQDGRTAVEYAIAINVLIIIAASAISASGYNGRQAVIKIADGVSAAYQSTEHTVACLLRGNRNSRAAGASHVGRP